MHDDRQHRFLAQGQGADPYKDRQHSIGDDSRSAVDSPIRMCLSWLSSTFVASISGCQVTRIGS